MSKDANDILRTEGGDAVARRLNEMKRNFEANREKLEEEARNAKAAADAEKAAAEKAAAEKNLLQKIFYLPSTDYDNARRIDAMFGDVIRYNKQNNCWGFFENGVWDFGATTDAALYPYTAKIVGFIFNNRPRPNYIQNADGSITSDPTKPSASVEAVKVGESLLNNWKKRKTQSAAIDLLKGVERILITQKDLDNHPMLLNVKNGVVNLEDGKLYPAAPELLLTKQANVIYKPAAKAPAFENFMQQIIPNDQTRAAVLRYLGYCLTGEVIEHKILFVEGDGGNGKGTLFGTIAELLGSYADTFDIEVILHQKSPRDPNNASPEIAKLNGLRFVYTPEIPAGREFDLAVLKRLSGGDKINARPLFGRPFTFEPQFKLICSGQYFPKIENPNDAGFKRRFLPVYFNQTFEDSNADLQLKDRLTQPAELSGILNILLAHCRQWQDEGLFLSEDMQREKQEYLKENDWIADFIENNCELGAEYITPRQDFLEELKKKKSQAYRFSDQKLTKMILKIKDISYAQKNFGKKRKVYCFLGVRLAEGST